MKDLKSWLLLFFGILFWIFRIIVAIYTQSEETFGGFVAFDLKIEIILLFVTVLSFIFIAKRNILGGILYTVTYCYYFGGYFITNVVLVLVEGNQVDNAVMQNGLVSLVGVLISVCTLFDIFFEKMKKKKYSDSKTDWFFNNKDTDRQMDDRADKNQYKFY